MSNKKLATRALTQLVAVAGLAALSLSSLAQSAFQTDMAITAQISRKITQDTAVRQAAYMLSAKLTLPADGTYLPPAPLGTLVNGVGTVPTTIGAPTTDGFGVPLGYCVWDNGTTTNAGGNILVGSASVNSISMAIISPGANNKIETTCDTVSTQVHKGGDDFVITYTVGQLAAGFGGANASAFGAPVLDVPALTTTSTNATASGASLPDGQVRLVTSTNTLYRYTAGTNTWMTLTGGSSQWLTGISPNAAGTDITFATGSVAIGGTTTTGARLTVAGANGILVNGNGPAGYNAAIFVNDTGKNLAVGVGGSTAAGYSQNNAFIGTISASPLLFGSNNLERMRLDAAGNLGIGGASNANVRVTAFDNSTNAAIVGVVNQAANAATITMYAGGSVGFGIPGWANAGVIEASGSGNGGLVMSASSGPMIFQTNNRIERMRIDAAGQVGIGGAASNAMLDIYGNTGNFPVTQAMIRVNNANGNAQSAIDFLNAGVFKGRVRSDYAGNMNYATNGGEHYFFVGGDAGTGLNPLRVNATGIVASGGAFSGPLSTVGVGVASDPYGRMSVTMPGDANSYGYYGMTRAGIQGWSIGIDSSNRVFFGTGGSGTQVNVPNRPLVIDTSGSLTTNGTINAAGAITSNTFLATAPGEGNGLNFWGAGSPYKIAMGAALAEYQYGTVTDYSIKMTMDNGSPGRGFTWGALGVKPVASLNAASGNFQVAGSIAAADGAFIVSAAGSITRINNNSSPNGVIRLTPNLHLNSYAGNAVIVNWDSGAVGGNVQQFRVGNGASADAMYVTADGGTFVQRINAGYDSAVPGSVNAANWFRSSGASGWFNATYGGGIWMQNSSNVEVYGGKNFMVGTGGGSLYSTQQMNATGNQGSGIGTNAGALGGVMVQGDGTNAAFMSFHRPGNYAAYLGIDTDNQFAVGGWSMGATRYVLMHSGNIGTYAAGLSTSNTFTNVNTFTQPITIGGGGSISYAATNAGFGSALTYRTTNSGSSSGSVAHIFCSSTAIDCLLANAVSIRGDNKVYSAGTVTVSDRAYKENIIALSATPELMSKFMQSRPVSYNLKSTGEFATGYIAQELKIQFPHMVEQLDETHFGVNYTAMIPIIHRVVQDQQLKIEAIEKNKMDNATGRWITSIDQKSRLYFEQSGKTIVRGHGDIAVEIRNAEDVSVVSFKRNGDMDLAGAVNFTGAKGGFAFNPTGTIVSSSNPGEIIVNSSRTMRAAVRLQHSDAGSQLASAQVYGMIFGDETGIGLSDGSGKALLTAHTDANGASSVKVAGTLIVGDGVSSSIRLGGETGIAASGDGSLQIEASNGVRVYNPKTKETVISLGSDGTIQAKRFLPTEVVSQNAMCDGQVGAIARDTNGQPMVCAK